MKTTDNKPIDLHAQTVQERNNYLLRALAAEEQRDAAVAALRDIIRYSEQPMGAIETHAIWAQARAVIAATQGS